MAQIDLKNCTVSVEDGYTGPDADGGTVDNVAGYAVAATTMAVADFTGKVEVGDRFQLTGDDTIYTISAHTETSTNTTSITFSPGLVIGATNNEVITILPHALEITLGEGTVSFDEKRVLQYILDRGKLSTGSVRLGDDQPMEVKFDLRWDFLKATSGEVIPTVEDALKKRGNASTWVTSGSDICEPYCVDIVILNAPPCTGVDTEEIRFPEFRYEQLSHDAKAGTISVTGKCKVTEALITRISAA